MCPAMNQIDTCSAGHCDGFSASVDGKLPKTRPDRLGKAIAGPDDVMAEEGDAQEADNMSPVTMVLDERLSEAPSPAKSRLAFRLRPIMRQGTASSIPETWERYGTLENARAAVKQAYHDDRVLRVFIVTDDVPPRFVEWVER